MAFTFDDTLADDVSRVRFAVGDIATPGLRPDDQYTALIARYGEEMAKSAMAQSLWTQWAQEPTTILEVGDEQISWPDRAKAWAALAAPYIAAFVVVPPSVMPLFGVVMSGPTRNAPPALNCDPDVSRGIP